MEILSAQKLKILKKTRIIAQVYTEFGNSDRELIDQLKESNLVENNGGLIFITDKGKAHLREYRRTSLFAWLPILISIASLIISIIALQSK